MLKPICENIFARIRKKDQKSKKKERGEIFNYNSTVVKTNSNSFIYDFLCYPIQDEPEDRLFKRF